MPLNRSDPADRRQQQKQAEQWAPEPLKVGDYVRVTSGAILGDDVGCIEEMRDSTKLFALVNGAKSRMWRAPSEIERWQPKIGDECEGIGVQTGTGFRGAFVGWCGLEAHATAALLKLIGGTRAVTRSSLRPIKDSRPASARPGAEDGAANGVAPAVENTGHLTASDPYILHPKRPAIKGHPATEADIALLTAEADAAAFAKLSASQRRERARRERKVEMATHPSSWPSDSWMDAMEGEG